MFADVVIYGGAKKDVLFIPREALIRTGNEERVIISEGDGRFSPRKVKAGIESGEYIEIISGLAEGENVVTSGQFLIDSEASLKASLKRMSGMPGSSKKPEIKIMGTGVLHEVLPGEHKVRMTHDPIKALDWPDMTMFFKVREGISLKGFKPDDKVEFELELEQGKDGYVIKAIKAR
jgi:Cu(I)/Ag(I) efflux system membrane fusion protein